MITNDYRRSRTARADPDRSYEERLSPGAAAGGWPPK
jgi:hypothetical protein